tara:strand:- start:865 stop:1485 length:621 start_codon:yes stop_codon:yes gene_type:complete
MKNLLTILALLFFVSCASVAPRALNGNIESFSNLEGTLEGPIFIEASSEEKKGKLEFVTYRNKFKNYLVNLGFQVTDEIANAEYVFFLDYGIGDEQIRSGSFGVPTWGSTGGGTTTFYGNTAVTTPSYGITGSRTQNYSYSQYPRFVTVDIFTKESQEKVYEMTLKSSGTCGAISLLMDGFIEGIFRNFPNNSGPFSASLGADFDC